MLDLEAIKAREKAADYAYCESGGCGKDIRALIEEVERLRGVCVSVLEKARCEIIAASRTFSVPLSDVTRESIDAVEIYEINGVINNLQRVYIVKSPDKSPDK